MIDTVNEKLAVMEWGQVWEPGLPISPGAFGQDDQQQLLWGYPGVLWGPLVPLPEFVCAHLTARAPSMTFASRAPSVTFTVVDCED